jgi:hypothetical protein
VRLALRRRACSTGFCRAVVDGISTAWPTMQNARPQSDGGEAFAGCENFAMLQGLNGRGDWIRTNDTLLPKQFQTLVEIW